MGECFMTKKYYVVMEKKSDVDFLFFFFWCLNNFFYFFKYRIKADDAHQFDRVQFKEFIFNLFI